MVNEIQTETRAHSMYSFNLNTTFQNATTADGNSTDDTPALRSYLNTTSKHTSHSLSTTTILVIAIVIPFGLAFLVIGAAIFSVHAQEKKFKAILAIG